MANCVFLIISSSVLPLTFTSGAFSSFGSLGNSSLAIPTMRYEALPDVSSA
jgi:hypothetical protein